MKGCCASSSCLKSLVPCLLRPLVFWGFRSKELLVLHTLFERLLQRTSTLSFGDDSWRCVIWTILETVGTPILCLLCSGTLGLSDARLLGILVSCFLETVGCWVLGYWDGGVDSTVLSY